MNGILSDLLLRVAKRRPCFRTQRVTRLYFATSDTSQRDGRITGKHEELCHTWLISFIVAFRLIFKSRACPGLCIFNLESILSIADFFWVTLIPAGADFGRCTG